MNMLHIRIAALAALLAAGPVAGEVYSLRPPSDGNPLSIPLRGVLLRTEKIEINGCPATLETTLVNRTLREALRTLSEPHRPGAVAMNANSLLLETKLRSDAKKRYFWVELGGMIPMLRFSLTLPANFRLNAVPRWPKEFPLPPGAVPRTVMQFAARGSVYGVFQSPSSPRRALAGLTHALGNRGWHSVDLESSASDASGGIFLRSNSREIMVVSVKALSPGRPGCAASLYFRRLPGR